MSFPANCKSCGAAIIWGITRNGKNAPLDAKPQKVTVLEGPPGGMFPPQCKVVDGYTNHFITCPNSEHHRRERLREGA